MADALPFQSFEDFVTSNPYREYHSSRIPTISAPNPAPMTTRGQAIRALKDNSTAGVNWLAVVQAALPSDESADANIFFNDGNWPLSGPAWANVKAWLLAGLANNGGFTDAQFNALQLQALNK